mgnify:CR=1 FL=1
MGSCKTGVTSGRGAGGRAGLGKPGPTPSLDPSAVSGVGARVADHYRRVWDITIPLSLGLAALVFAMQRPQAPPQPQIVEKIVQVPTCAHEARPAVKHPKRIKKKARVKKNPRRKVDLPKSESTKQDAISVDCLLDPTKC